MDFGFKPSSKLIPSRKWDVSLFGSNFSTHRRGRCKHLRRRDETAADRITRTERQNRSANSPLRAKRKKKLQLTGLSLFRKHFFHLRSAVDLQIKHKTKESARERGVT
ncbi:hypothetical protein CEXT_611271 [Caerostris extrusa]|uniref:Uncharacterized protein n=1 Tax=Caerostris extrusa TaxID=172846 RepID=A0AAV4MIB7_CAEEX|nr:hypothetical protein CEXT_611271 [Caerostris extrusa]